MYESMKMMNEQLCQRLMIEDEMNNATTKYTLHEVAGGMVLQLRVW